jgi:hypothetical protein
VFVVTAETGIEYGGMPMFEVAFQLVAPLVESESNREFVQAIKGEIRDTKLNIVVGRISALLVQVGRVADAGEDLFEVMDGESNELGKYHSAFFKSDDCDYKDKIRQQFVDIFGLDLLIIHYVEIQRTFQRHGFGLLAVSRTIDIFGENCGLVAMKPFPLQFTNYLDPGWRPPESIENSTRAFRAATQKLRSHWARVGFKRVNGTGYCALSPARKRPSLRTIAAAIRQMGGPGGQQGSRLFGIPVEPEACSRRLLEEMPRLPYK